MVKSIKEVLIERDGMTCDEADELIAEAQDAFNSAINSGDFSYAEEVCSDYFGLEPDYLEELM